MADIYDFDIAEKFYQETGQQLSAATENVWKRTAFGGIKTAIGDNIYGINHRQTPGSIGINRDYFGLTFFTRPCFNLSTENIRAIREFGPMLTQQAESYPRIVRCLLDPDLATHQTITSPFVDPDQMFIPLLTNTMLSCTGWPDLEAQTFTSHEGIMKESYSFVDSSIRLYGTYDITCTFRNIPGDPIILMFYTWLFYMSLVYLGDIIPYPDFILNNEIDYMTRIYRLVLDPSKRFVTKIAAANAAFPTNVPYGAAINHDADHPINANNDQISITFRTNGVTYHDPILVHEFNRAVAMYNGGMNPDNFKTTKDKNGLYVSTNPYLKQIPLHALGVFNNRGYARINPYTYELEWWIDEQEYNYRLPLVN